MKKLIFGFCVTMTISFGSQAWATSMLYFEPFVTSIYLGESVDVNVVITDLEAKDDFSAFDFNVLFDDTVLAFDSYSLTDNLGEVGGPDPFFPDADDWSLGHLSDGTVNIAEMSWLWDLSFQDDSFVLATLSFTGIGAGGSALLFDNIMIGDAGGSAVFTIPSFGVVEVNSVNPVPEPSTIILFGIGITGLAGIRSRKNKKA